MSLHSQGGQNGVQSNTNEPLVLNTTENKEFPSAEICTKPKPTTNESNYAGLLCQPENQEEISNGIKSPRLKSKDLFHFLKTDSEAADIKNSSNNECHHSDETTSNVNLVSKPNRGLREDSEEPSFSSESSDVKSNLSPVASLGKNKKIGNTSR